MSLNAVFFHFPGLAHVHCLFPLRDQDLSEDGDARLGGNLSFEVGDSRERVRSTRKRLLDCYRGFGLKRLCDAHQVHACDLLFLEEKALGDDPVLDAGLSLQAADGLATCEAGLGLLIKTADCQPLLITDKNGRFLLALHVGWRGNASDFIAKAIETFCRRFALKASDLLAVRGPSLGPDKAEFVHFQREWPERFSPWFDSRSHSMDLWGLTRYQLTQAGLAPRHIYGLDLCTATNSQCFSYRRDKVCGRQGGIIWREAQPNEE